MVLYLTTASTLLLVFVAIYMKNEQKKRLKRRPVPVKFDRHQQKPE